MSDVFCGQCGVQATGGKFCRNCGAPLPVAPQVAPEPAAEETTVLPATPPPVQPESPQYQQPAPGYPQYTPAPAAPVINPFKGVPLSDLARDAAALFLLFGSLALIWDFGHDASDRWWVVIATIISAASVAVPYLVSLNVIPGWGAAQSRVVKYLCFLPYGVSVLAAVIVELTHVGDERGLNSFGGLGIGVQQLESALESLSLGDLSEFTDFDIPTVGGGLGPAVFVGLAGALLAMQSRRSDQEPTGAHDGAWRTGVFALLGVGTALYVVTTLISMATSFDEDVSVAAILGVTLFGIALAAVLLLSLAGLVQGGREWARVLAVTGFGFVASQFFAGVSDSLNPLFARQFEAFDYAIGLFLVTAGVALLVSHPIQRRLPSLPAIQSWVQTAQNASIVVAVALGLAAVARLLVMIGIKNDGEDEAISGSSITALVLLLLGAGVAVFINVLLRSNADLYRKVVVGLVGGIYLLAITEIAVGRSGDFYGSVYPVEALAWFALPGLILWSLLVPAEIRTSFQPIASTPQGYQQPTPGFPAPPQQPGQQPPPPGYQPPPS